MRSALGHVVRRGAAGHVCRRWRRMHPTEFYQATGRAPSPPPSDCESDDGTTSPDPDLTQTYSLPPSILKIVEAGRDRVGRRL